jgi:peptidoglycan/LPS O-acetylase OafA/YrhL
MKRRTIPSLNGLRALAALAVLLAHHQPGPADDPSYPWWQTVMTTQTRLAGGILAVVVFFVLSGFLLAAGLTAEIDTTGKVDRWRFLARRARRIWPLYGVVVAVVAFVLPPAIAAFPDANRPWVYAHLWMFAVFGSNWSLGLAGSGDRVNQFGPPLDVLWTIAVEWWFYAVLAVLFPIIISMRRWWLAFSALLLAGVVARVAWAWLFPEIAMNMYVATTTYIDLFALGCLAGAAWARYPDRVRSVCRHRLAGPSIAGAAVVMHQVLTVPAFGANLSVFILFYGVFGGVLALIMLWLASNENTWVARVLGCAPLQWLGALSFGIYVWHMPVEFAAREMFTPWSTWASLLSLPLVVTGTVLVAALTYWAVERQFLRWRVA